MIITIYSFDSPPVIKEKIKTFLTKENRTLTKKFDAKRFCGALKTTENAFKAQLRLRNEWD